MLDSEKRDIQHSERNFRLSKAKETRTMATTMVQPRPAMPHSSSAISRSTLLEIWRTASSVLRTSIMVRLIGSVVMKRGSGVNSFKRFFVYDLREFAELVIPDVCAACPVRAALLRKFMA